MKKMMKKILATTLLLSLVVSLAMPVAAASSTNYYGKELSLLFNLGSYSQSSYNSSASNYMSVFNQLFADEEISKYIAEAFATTPTKTTTTKKSKTYKSTQKTKKIVDGFGSDGYLYKNGVRYYYVGQATREQMRLTGETGFGYIYGGISYYVYNGSLYKIKS